MTKRIVTRVLSGMLSLLILLSMAPALNISAAEAEIKDLAALAPDAELAADVQISEVTGTTADGFGYEINDGEVTINEYTGTATELTIPSTIDGYSVTVINHSAFYECSSLISVTIPEGVTTIGYTVFKNCTSLKNIVIPETVKSIGDSAFFDCSSLMDLSIPKSVNDLGCHAFTGTGFYLNEDNWQDEVLYKDNILIKAKETVSGCYSVKAGTTLIADGAFNLCTELEGIVIPDSVTTIGDQAFYKCSALNDIALPENITRIGYDAFSDTGYYKNKDNWDSSGAELYINKYLISADIDYGGPKNGTVLIADCAFFQIGTPANTDHRYTFYVPASLKYIGIGAFSSIQWFDYYLDKVNVQDINAWCRIKFAADTSNPLYYAEELSFGVAPNNTSVVVPNDVTEISPYLFSCNNIESIVIGSNVTKIGNGAFSNCSNLKSLTINSTKVTEIGDYAFLGCSSLESVRIPPNVTAIGEDCFKGCENLKRVYISNIESWCNIKFYSYSTPMEYAEELYYNNSLLTNVVIPDGVTEISYKAFSYKGLRSVTIPDSVTHIWSSVFEGTSLRTVTIPDSVTYIGYRAFANCTILDSVTMSSGIETIGENAFVNCWALDNVYISDIASWCECIMRSSNTTPLYQSNPLYYADNLYLNNELVKHLEIPEGVTRIGHYALSFTSLESLVIPTSIQDIYNDSFSGASSLKHVTYAGDQEMWNNLHHWAFFTGLDEAKNLEKFHVAAGKEPFVFKETIAPTCTQKGYDKYKCYKCDYEIAMNHTQAIEHDLVFVETIGVSCTSGGYDWYSCSVCHNDFYYPNSVVPGHKYEFVEKIAPTCIEEGYDLYKCSVCQDENKENIVLHSSSHNMKFAQTVVPNCTEGGYDIYRCSVCGENEIHKNFTNSLGHSMSGISCVICGYVNEELFVESMHPYENNTDKSWEIDIPGVENIALTFSEDTWTEKGYDYIYIYNSKDREIGKYTGKALAGKTIVVDGNAVRIRLKSDDGNVYYGFSVTEVIVNYDGKGDVPYNSEFTKSDEAKIYIETPDGYLSHSKDTSSCKIGCFIFDSNGKALAMYGQKVTECRKVEGQDNLYYYDISKLDEFENGKTYSLMLYHTMCGENTCKVLISSECYGDTLHFDSVKNNDGENVIYWKNQDKAIWGPVKDQESSIPEKDPTAPDEPTQPEIPSTVPELEIDFLYSIDVSSGLFPVFEGYNTIVFTADWEDVCIYMWDETEGEYYDWPGIPMKFVQINEYGENVFVAYIRDIYDGYIINDGGKGKQTQDICILPSYGIHITQRNANGKYDFEYFDPMFYEWSFDVPTLPEEDSPTDPTESVTDVIFPDDYLTDEDTDIGVAGVTIEAELVVSQIISENLIEDVDLILIGEKVLKVFDITLQKEGVEVQPDGLVTVRIPAENPDSKVYRVESDETLTDMNAVYQDGYLIFTTEHFSLYVVAGPEAESETTEPPTIMSPPYLVGDANGDGKINVKDATWIQKAVAALVVLDDVQIFAADANEDEKVNVKDATAIQKFVAGIPVNFPIGEERIREY